MNTSKLDLESLAARADHVAATLKTLASGPRLMVLCNLAQEGEMRVGEIADLVGLSQSALSQHLARMREEGLVAFRREGQSLFYRVADARCEALLTTLHRLYCSAED